MAHLSRVLPKKSTIVATSSRLTEALALHALGLSVCKPAPVVTDSLPCARSHNKVESKEKNSQNAMSDQTKLSEPEKLDLRSSDIVGEKQSELLRLFPEVRTEGGKIDFERLKAALGEQIDSGRERYGMNWPGKAECMMSVQAPSMGTLLPMLAESVDWETTGHAIIEGDNLEVLKLLRQSYLGKIKMIYIDPPYNTGKDFIYPDNFSESLQTYLEYTGQVDTEGRKFSNNTDTDGRFHSKWLNMMFPRLYIARDLLMEDGLLFLSIDDREHRNMRILCDEIFGEENFLANIIWEKRITRENRSAFSVRHDHILIYSKSSFDATASLGLLPMDGDALDRYKNPDNDERGKWTSVPAIAQAGHGTKSQFYTLVTPAGRSIDPPSGSCWRYTRDKMDREIEAGNIWFGSDGNGVPRIKKFLTQGRQGLTPETIWWAKDVGTNDTAKRALVDLFNGEAVFDTPKPHTLLQRMLEILDDPAATVLDFFAGSGPLGQAVLEQNAKDGGCRKYIMVQLPETTELASHPTISSICVDRMRRISERMRTAQGNLLAQAAVGDIGFRSFKLAPSNFIPWDGTASNDAQQLAEQLQLNIEHTRDDRTPFDLLYEVLLKSWGEPALSLTVTEDEIEGVKVFSIADNAFIIYLGESVSLEFIRAVAARKPDRVVMRESAFAGDDQLKTNAVQTFKTKGVTSFKVV